MDLLPDSVLFVDRDWNISFANRQAVALLGSGPLLGQNLWELFPHTRLEPFFSSYRATMEQRVPTEFEAFYPEPLHSWYRVFARPFEDGISIILNDVTAQKAAEERRDEATQRLEEVFAATADSIVCVGPDWRCTYANARAQELLGNRNLVGAELWTHFPGNQKEPFASNYRRAMGERVVTEFEAHPADPTERLVAGCRPSVSRRHCDLVVRHYGAQAGRVGPRSGRRRAGAGAGRYHRRDPRL